MGNAAVSQQELHQLRKKYDADDDGLLSFPEASLLAEEIRIKEGLASSIPDTYLKTLFKKIDRDGNGFISLAEFEGLHAIIQQQRQARAKTGKTGSSRSSGTAQTPRANSQPHQAPSAISQVAPPPDARAVNRQYDRSLSPGPKLVGGAPKMAKAGAPKAAPKTTAEAKPKAKMKAKAKPKAEGEAEAEAKPTAKGKGKAADDRIWLEVGAGQADKALGMTPTVPPGRVMVEAVTDAGWAAKAGVMVGAEILTINKKLAMDMDKDEFVEAMKPRPLRFRLLVPLKGKMVELNAGKGEEKLGLVPKFPPQPGKVMVEKVEANTWASDKGILEGNEIIALNGKVCEVMKKDQLVMCMRERPLRFTILQASEGIDFDGRWRNLDNEERFIINAKKAQNYKKREEIFRFFPDKADASCMLQIPGEAFYGELTEDGRIRWSEGPAWMREQPFNGTWLTEVEVEGEEGKEGEEAKTETHKYVVAGEQVRNLTDGDVYPFEQTNQTICAMDLEDEGGMLDGKLVEGRRIEWNHGEIWTRETMWEGRWQEMNADLDKVVVAGGIAQYLESGEESEFFAQDEDSVVRRKLVNIGGKMLYDTKIKWDNGWVWKLEAKRPEIGTTIMTEKEAREERRRLKPKPPLQVVPFEPPLPETSLWSNVVASEYAAAQQREAGHGETGWNRRRRSIKSRSDQAMEFATGRQYDEVKEQEAAQLSDPESESSVESISGEVKPAWDRGIREERYRYTRDRAIEFSEKWSPLNWTWDEWETHLSKMGALMPAEDREDKKVWKMSDNGGISMGVESKSGEVQEMWAADEDEVDRGKIFQAVAGHAVKKLGMTPELPPGKVFVVAVETGGWAATQGICEGAEIVKVNEKPAEEMSREKFLKALKKTERPVRFTVAISSEVLELHQQELEEALEMERQQMEWEREQRDQEEFLRQQAAKAAAEAAAEARRIQQQQDAAKEVMKEYRKAWEKVPELTPRDLPIFKHPDMVESCEVYYSLAADVQEDLLRRQILSDGFDHGSTQTPLSASIGASAPGTPRSPRSFTPRGVPLSPRLASLVQPSLGVPRSGPLSPRLLPGEPRSFGGLTAEDLESDIAPWKGGHIMPPLRLPYNSPSTPGMPPSPLGGTPRGTTSTGTLKTSEEMMMGELASSHAMWL